MSQRDLRRFRPLLDRLEDVVLLSSNVVPAVRLPTQGLIDFKSSNLVTDLRTTILHTTPIDGRQSVVVRLLSVDPTTRTVYGSVGLLYKVRPIVGYFVPIFHETKVKVEIAFATKIDAPKVGDVKIASGHDLLSFNSKVRRTLSQGIVNLIKKNQAVISSMIR